MAVQGIKLSIFPGKSQNKINLLFREGFENSTRGKILNWAVTTGRVIVLLTELVVIVAFISRFWLDRTLANLNEDNNKKKSQVELSLTFENDFKSVQTRLATYKNINSSNFKSSNQIEEISKFLPEDTVLTNLALNENNIEIKGKAFTEQGLAIFLKGLKSSSKYTNIRLEDISVTTGENTFDYLVRADYKNKKVEPAKKEPGQEENTKEVL